MQNSQTPKKSERTDGALAEYELESRFISVDSICTTVSLSLCVCGI